MNKYTEITPKDITRRFNLEGITITDLIMEGPNLKALTMVDKKGTTIKFQYMDYRVSLFALEEPQYEEKWVLKGTFKGLVVKEIFDYETEAVLRKRYLDDCSTLVINKEMVEVTNA